MKPSGHVVSGNYVPGWAIRTGEAGSRVLFFVFLWASLERRHRGGTPWGLGRWLSSVGSGRDDLLPEGLASDTTLLPRGIFDQPRATPGPGAGRRRLHR